MVAVTPSRWASRVGGILGSRESAGGVTPGKKTCPVTLTLYRGFAVQSAATTVFP